MMVAAYVGLGSNLDGPRRRVSAAFDDLARLPRTRVASRSSLYRSEPMGPPGQPDYVNAVVALDTGLEPHALLRELQAIETRRGRQRGPERWGPRTLDLDLLLYGDLCLADPDLTLPHPGLTRRAFVLHPLHEVAPALVLPDGRPLAQLLDACPPAGLERLGAAP